MATTKIERPLVELLSKESNIRDWFERYDCFVSVNDLNAARDGEDNDAAEKWKMSLFVTCVDGEMYSLIKSLVTPAKVIDNKYDDVKILQENANEQ